MSEQWINELRMASKNSLMNLVAGLLGAFEATQVGMDGLDEFTSMVRREYNRMAFA